MSAALRAELRKLTSTSLWWVLLVCQAGYLAMMGAVMAFAFTAEAPDGSGTTAPALAGVDAATATYSLVNSIGYVFPLVVGALLMTSEFRHGTLAQSLLVEPRRGVLLAGKLAIAVPLGLVYGLVGVAALVLGGGALLSWQGDGAFLGDPEVLTVLALGAVASAMWAVIGAAFGSVVTNQVAAVVVVLAFTQLVEPIARLGLGAVDGLDAVARYLPGAAADALLGAGIFTEIGAGETLGRPAGLLVMVGYAVALAVLARFTTLRRDLG